MRWLSDLAKVIPVSGSARISFLVLVVVFFKATPHLSEVNYYQVHIFILHPKSILVIKMIKLFIASL